MIHLVITEIRLIINAVKYTPNNVLTQLFDIKVRLTNVINL